MGQPLAFRVFVASRWATTGVIGYRLSPGTSSCVSVRWLPHLDIISSWPCIWQSCFRCLAVARGVQVLDFSGDAAFLWGAMLGSTVNTCSASVRDAFGRVAHNFYVAVDSNPEVWVSVLAQNGEVCSVDGCLGCLNSDFLRRSCTELAGCMMQG